MVSTSLLDLFPPEHHDALIEVLRENPALVNRWAMAEQLAYTTFVPRPDRPEMFDEQAGFCYNHDKVSMLIGGNAAGTTSAAAFKTAQFVLNVQPPPRKDTPFWIGSNTYEQVEDVCWKEKLLGDGHIPVGEIDWSRVKYSGGHLSKVPLKPWRPEKGGDPNKNWTLEFKSFEQGRQALQAKSIGGFWFSEQFPLDRFLETIRGCRDYFFPGSMFCEFTPIDPVLALWVEEIMDKMPEGWRFYRCNTECNRANLAEGWFESFFAAVPDEMRDTRMTGALAGFEGVIYQGFNLSVHVIRGRLDPDDIPTGVFHYRGVDWGASSEHPFTCCWGYRDGIGDWTIFDEYWSIDQTAITFDHAKEIADRSAYWGWPGYWDDTAPKGGVWHPHQSGNHCETYADPSRPGEINEFCLRGIPTMPAGNDVFKGIDCIRSMLKPRPNGLPRLRIHERCKHLIEEMRKYRWVRGKKPTQGGVLNPRSPIPTPLKRDDDLCDASRYMIFSAERGRGAVPGSMSHREYVAKRGSVQLKGVDRVARKAETWFTKGS